MLVPLLVILSLFSLSSLSAYATKCPDLTACDLADELISELSLEPTHDDEPTWYLLNPTSGNTSEIGKLLTCKDLVIEKLDDTATFKGAENDIVDEHEDSIRIYCRYAASGSKRVKLEKQDSDTVKLKTVNYTHSFILYSELLYISKKEKEKLEKIEDVDTLPEAKIPFIISRRPAMIPLFMMGNPRLIGAYRLGLMMPYIALPRIKAPPQKNNNNDNGND